MFYKWYEKRFCLVFWRERQLYGNKQCCDFFSVFLILIVHGVIFPRSALIWMKGLNLSAKCAAECIMWMSIFPVVINSYSISSTGRKERCCWVAGTGKLFWIFLTFIMFSSTYITCVGIQVFVRKVIELHDKFMAYVNDCFLNHTLFHKVSRIWIASYLFCLLLTLALVYDYFSLSN